MIALLQATPITPPVKISDTCTTRTPMSGLEDVQQACRALLEVLLLVQGGVCIVLLSSGEGVFSLRCRGVGSIVL